MPFSIDITLNVLWISSICVIFTIVGFIFRSVQLNKLREQIYRLENQLRQSDAEVLVLQKETATLQEQLKNNPVPVIPITSKENAETLPDASARKKLLSK